MKPLLIASFLFALALAAPAAAPLSPEARAVFAWFGSLGYLNVKEALWTEVWIADGSGRGSQPEAGRIILAFVTSKEGAPHEILTPDLVEPKKEFTSVFDSPAKRGGRELPSFEASAQQYLDTLKKFALSPEMWSIKDSRLGHRSQIFFMAYAAWQRGHIELAQELYDQAAHLPTRQGDKAPPEGVKFQDLLEQEMGRAVMWRAAQMFVTNKDYAPHHLPLPARPEVLARFQEVIRRFPNCPDAPQAERTAEILEQMIAEDKNHPSVSRLELSKLSTDEQVRELIFQLRDQTAEQITIPGTPDIFQLHNGLIQTPASQLADIGVPAVPQLIAALADNRFTRACTFQGDLVLKKHTLSIGDCATLVLERIAVRSLRPFRFNTNLDIPAVIDTKLLNEWWQEVQTKGEERTLVDAISSGTMPSKDLARVLNSRNPRALRPALVAGLRNARSQEVFNEIEEVLQDVSRDTANDTLLTLLRLPPSPESKLLAIRKLWDRGNPEALPAALLEFEKQPASHVGAREELMIGGYAKFLAGCGDSTAMRAVLKRWEDLPSRTRYSVVVLSSEILATQNHEPMSSINGRSIVRWDEVSREAALQLLITALNDPSPINGLVSYGWPKSPRVCDVALSALHKIEPEVFLFTPKAGATQWDEEKAAGLKRWEERQVGKK